MTLPFLILSSFALVSPPFCTTVIATTLICAHIWYLSPRKARNMRSVQFPTGTGWTIIKIVVESGMLQLVVQLIFVVLCVIGNPVLGITRVIAVQIAVRIPYPWKAKNSL